MGGAARKAATGDPRRGPSRRLPVAVALGAGVLAGVLAGRFWPDAPTAAPEAPAGAPAPDASAAPVPGNAPPPSAAAAGTVARADVEESAGPWGRLRIAPVLLVPRLDTVEDSDCPRSMPPWVFPGATLPGLLDRLSAAGLDPALRKPLEAVTACDPAGCVVRPTLEMARRLGPGARAAVYSVQVRQKGGLWNDLTRRYGDGDLETWLDAADMAEEERSLVRSLSYRLDGEMAVSDLPVLCAAEPGAVGRRSVARMWSASRALIVSLRVQPGDDLGPVIDWWRRWTPVKDVGSLLESAAHVKGGVSVDVVHLLPRQVRQLLNTYPADRSDTRHCWWTALNFGRAQADDRFLDNREVAQALRRDWVRAEGQAPRLGDLLLLEDSSGDAWHVVVYIADGVVYTKNGPSIYQPWILSHLSDVMRLYGSQQDLRAVTYRPRDP